MSLFFKSRQLELSIEAYVSVIYDPNITEVILCTCADTFRGMQRGSWQAGGGVGYLLGSKDDATVALRRWEGGWLMKEN